MYDKICRYCGKKIEGTNEKQVTHLMYQHMIARHMDKLTITEHE